MRIDRVEAIAFGPLVGQTLELAPGMTVVHGQNEAGKSSWHAAVYAGLCGVRRGKGQPLLDDRRFRDLHKPWDDERWEVEARIRLEDGRRIELRQDLAGRVACRATDLDLGLDVSNEIMFDGSPDASRWLGLDRRAFRATACIEQAELLAIADEPDRLQEYIQRAAATRGTDATAAAAIDRLEEFRRAQVGEDRANSTKPLRRAREAREAAARALDDARARHAAFLELAAEAEAARERSDRHEAGTRPLVAAAARIRAADARRRADRVRELAARHPAGAPAGMVRRDELADRVAGALEAWDGRPARIVLDGPNADELALALERLPAEPTGDTTPAAEVLQARTDYDRRSEAVRVLEARPPEPTWPETGGLEVDELTGIALALEAQGAVAPVAAAAPGPGPEPGTVGRTGPAGIARWQALAGAALVAAVVGILSIAVTSGPGSGLLLVGPALLVAAVVLAVTAVLDRRTATETGGTVAAARDEIGPVGPREDVAAAAVARARAAGLQPDPAALRSLAIALAEARAAAARLADWTRTDAERRVAASAAEAALRAALAAHGTAPSGDGAGVDLEADFTRYLADCRNRAERARDAGRAAALAQALEARRGLERNAATVAARLATIETALREAAARIRAEHAASAEPPRTSPDDPAGLADELRAWQAGRAGQAAADEVALREWRELELLLGGRSVAELAADADRAEDQAASAAVGLDPATIAAVDPGPDPDRRIAELQAEADRLRTVTDQAHGRLAEVERSLPGVAEAEERLAAAETELARVERLDGVLQATLGFLRRAEERIHRDLAPVLGAAITAQLPRVSDGRYVEAAVNPADLAVRVKAAGGGQWRDARRLSHGTREQVYLLLRLAMTEQLVTRGEIAPLLCDEVTVQSDQRRAFEMLDLLHEVSRDRQVVVFTHDERALAWAEANLGEHGAMSGAPNGRDRLVRLEPPAAIA